MGVREAIFKPPAFSSSGPSLPPCKPVVQILNSEFTAMFHHVGQITEPCL